MLLEKFAFQKAIKTQLNKIQHLNILKNGRLKANNMPFKPAAYYYLTKILINYYVLN